ncbi:MAG: PEP/pyruvate-binding domain-containing protein [Acidimicrobiia bacterium]|nr:PEP/pyruvate-binding domain-containing protein [Acidimicrobiia bacterium]
MTDTRPQTTSTDHDTPVVDLGEVSVHDVEHAGGKGANLGELRRRGLPVPGGFVITAPAYLRAMQEGEVRDELADRARATVTGDPDDLPADAAALRDLVRRAGVAEDLRDAIHHAYDALGGGPVAVRSSATAEDAADTSFAGMNETYTNVVGAEALIDRVVDCWASLFGDRVVSYRSSRGLDDEPAIAVVVQRMVDAESSGVMFTVDPSSGDPEHLVIEAAFGLGEVVVGGQVEPDTYVVAREGPRVSTVRVGHKAFRIVRDPDGSERHEDLDPATGRSRVLDDDRILEVARLGLRVEEHYGAPQDTEWAVEDDVLWLLQSRPITTLGTRRSGEPARSDAEPVASGSAPRPVWRPVRCGSSGSRARARASPTGRSCVAADDHARLGTDAPIAPAAIVTDGGGMTCHAAIVSRELGIPAVVGTRDATTTLRDGEVVTVDGAHGVVLEGAVAPKEEPRPTTGSAATTTTTVEPLGTKLYVNLAIAERAADVAALPVDGVGLLRAEFMITDALRGVHPAHLVAQGRGREFVDRMVEQLLTVTRAFDPRPVVYRTTDFRTNEFRALEGGDRFEPAEENPMIGFRGCYRYLLEPEVFGLELRRARAGCGRSPRTST